MNTIEKNEVNTGCINQKNDNYIKDIESLSLNVLDQEKIYLGDKDRETFLEYIPEFKLKNWIFRIKKRINTFYFIYAIVTIIHFLIYVNRGLLPGSYTYLSTYLKETHRVVEVDTHIGLLTSVFILGLSISSVITGSLASAFDIFRITDIFLFQNSIALFITSISFVIGSYYTLLFSRFFCGFSEAAFITIIPPLIYSYSKNRAGAWISFFIIMFPLGGCVGYLLAIIIPIFKVTVAQYYSFIGCVFALFFIIFYFFDEKLLKKYENEKSLKEEEMKKEKNLENEKLKDEKNLKDEQNLKDMKTYNEDYNMTVDKTYSPEIESLFIPYATTKVENKKNDNIKNKIKENNNNNNNNNMGLKKVENRNEEKEEINEIQKGNEKKLYKNKKEKKSKRKKKEKEKETEKETDSEIVKIIGNDNILNSNSLNLRKSKSKNLYKNKNLKSDILSLKFSESKKMSSSHLRNFTNLKHISCVKKNNASDNSKNKNSTDYSDHKSNDDPYQLYKKNEIKLDEDLLYNVETPLDASNNSSNSTRKNNEDNNCFISKDERTNNIEEKIVDSNYIEEKLGHDYKFSSSCKEEQPCLVNMQESFDKEKKEKNFLEIEMNDNLDVDKNKDEEKISLSMFVNSTLLNPSFIFLVTVLTAHMDIIQNFLVYGAPILYALDVYPSYEISTIICSMCACFSSILGTYLGGFFMDLYDLNIQNIDKNYEHIKNNEKKVKLYKKDTLVFKYIRIIGIQATIILFLTSLFVLMLPFISDFYIFTIVLTIGLTLLFASMPYNNIGVMACVPHNIRAFSVGMSLFISHMLGDIPWTTITGKIKATLAPNCDISRVEGINPLCREQKWGLRMTLLIICSKSLIMAFGSLSLYLYSNKKLKKSKKILKT